MDRTSNESVARVRIDRELSASGWDPTNRQQVELETHTSVGRADYLLKDSAGRVLCVLEAKRADLDPYDAKEQARGYATNLGAPFVILSNGEDHWFWNLQRALELDAHRIERFPSPHDLERLRLRNLRPPVPLGSEAIGPDYLRSLDPALKLRGYQLDALGAIASGFDRGQRKFLLEMATGTGKTLLCAALLRRFLGTRNAERALFIVDRIELARQTLEVFGKVLPEYRPVLFKSARHTGELLGSSVVVATIQSLMSGRRYRTEFTPFYFDLVVNDEAHRSIYGDAREAVQFFQATRVGLTATPKSYLRNVDAAALSVESPRVLEARQLRDTYRYFGCEPGEPSFRYDIRDAVGDPEGPFLCMPRILDCRSDITTQALEEAGWSVIVDENEESYKISDLERKIFTPHRNRVMCEALLREAYREPSGELGRSLVFAVNQQHASSITKILNELRPGVALTITSRVPDASRLAKEFRDGKRRERIAVSVDMLSTGYNCPDLLNIALMRPVFSPTEYLQIKGRGTRLHTFHVGNAEYDKRFFFLIDFCAVAEYFEERYDYTAPLPISITTARRHSSTGHSVRDSAASYQGTSPLSSSDKRDIPTWEGPDRIVSRAVKIVGPNGEKVDILSFRGAFERDVREFYELDEDLASAVEREDDFEIDRIVQERFYHRPELFYAPNKLVATYGVPASTAAFIYHALGIRRLPSREELVGDTVDSIAARFNLRYADAKWLAATAALVTTDDAAMDLFMRGAYQPIFDRGQFRALGGLDRLLDFEDRERVFEALRTSPLLESAAQQSLLGSER